MLVGASERRLSEFLAGTRFRNFLSWFFPKAGEGSRVATGEL